MDKPPIAFPGKDDARRMGGRVRDLLCVYISLGVSALHSQRLAATECADWVQARHRRSLVHTAEEAESG
jgi:hypothetical protein